MSSVVRRLHERFDATARAVRRTRERMRAATSYREWRELAEQLDALDAGRVGGRCSFEESKVYDRKLLLQKLAHLRRVRAGGNIREVMFNLRADLIRNVANVAKSQLHERCYTVPSAIRDYIAEVQAQLAALADWPEAGVPLDEKLAFFREARHAYGRTALLLSGGGGLGSFHIVRAAGGAAAAAGRGSFVCACRPRPNTHHAAEHKTHTNYIPHHIPHQTGRRQGAL